MILVIVQSISGIHKTIRDHLEIFKYESTFGNLV
jgi:hypothetical protein